MSTNLLIIDDDEDIRLIVEAVLGDSGQFTVTSAATADAGLRLAAAMLPEVILLDVLLPDLDGRELFSRLTALPGLRDTKIIFMTAKSDSSVTAGLTACGIIRKPFNPLNLAEQVNQLIRTD
ncbi:MAG: response regulator [Candidatus Neomarinimicrobiota bacterium]